MTEITKQELLVKDEAILIAEIIMAKAQLSVLQNDLKEVRKALKEYEAQPVPEVAGQE